MVTAWRVSARYLGMCSEKNVSFNYHIYIAIHLILKSLQVAYNKNNYDLKILKQLQLKIINNINNKTVEKIYVKNNAAISSKLRLLETPRSAVREFRKDVIDGSQSYLRGNNVPRGRWHDRKGWSSGFLQMNLFCRQHLQHTSFAGPNGKGRCNWAEAVPQISQPHVMCVRKIE